MTVKEIEAKMADKINETLGTSIEVTNRGTGLYTISGFAEDVDKAVAFLADNKVMVEQSREYDEELDETFAYMGEVN